MPPAPDGGIGRRTQAFAAGGGKGRSSDAGEFRPDLNGIPPFGRQPAKGSFSPRPQKTADPPNSIRPVSSRSARKGCPKGRPEKAVTDGSKKTAGRKDNRKTLQRARRKDCQHERQPENIATDGSRKEGRKNICKNGGKQTQQPAGKQPEAEKDAGEGRPAQTPTPQTRPAPRRAFPASGTGSDRQTAA